MKNVPDTAWEEEDLRRFFTLTLEDLRFVASVRADTMRLYRALVLIWARVERVLSSNHALFQRQSWRLCASNLASSLTYSPASRSIPLPPGRRPTRP